MKDVLVLIFYLGDKRKKKENDVRRGVYPSCTRQH